MGAVPEPTAALHALRASTADLLQGLAAEKWRDTDVAEPSLCDGWTRGHVLTHLARNADGIAATLAGALRGEIVERYPGGRTARDAAIEDGAHRTFAELRADVEESAERLDRVLGAVADSGAWDRTTAEERPAADWVFARVREVEIHRVDLRGSYTPDRWPPFLVGELLPVAAATLDERAHESLVVRVRGPHVEDLDGRVWACGEGVTATEVAGPDWALLAWLVGRGQVAAQALTACPPLAPWR